MAKYRLGSLTLEAVGVFVRVEVASIGGPNARVRVAKTKKHPTAQEVAELVASIRGYWPDAAVLSACSRAAEDARKAA